VSIEEHDIDGKRHTKCVYAATGIQQKSIAMLEWGVPQQAAKALPETRGHMNVAGDQRAINNYPNAWRTHFANHRS